MRYHFVVNPVAGRRAALPLAERVRGLLHEAGAETTCHVTSAAGDASLHVAGLDPAALDRLVVVGGDGTLREVVNAKATPPPRIRSPEILFDIREVYGARAILMDSAISDTELGSSVRYSKDVGWPMPSRIPGLGERRLTGDAGAQPPAFSVAQGPIGMRYHFVVNPVAGRRAALPLAERVRGLLHEAGAETTCHVTSAAGDAFRAQRRLT